MGIPQPKVSAMLRGDFTNLSERKLMDCLNRLGYDIEIRVKPTTDPVGHLRLAIWQAARPAARSARQAGTSDVRRARRTLKALAISTPCTIASARNTPLYWWWSIKPPNIRGATAWPMSSPE